MLGSLTGTGSRGQTVVRWAACVALIGGAVAAGKRGVAEVLTASADRDRVGWAIRIDDGEAYRHVALSKLLEDAGEDPRPELQASIRLQPADALLWVRLGLAEESAGRAAEAEKFLLEAAKRSTKHEVKWALANFYFRQANAGEFVRWTKAALENAYGDVRTLFDLCTTLIPDGERVRREILPARRPVWLQYATHAASKRRWTEAEAAAEWLGEPQDADERRALSDLVGTLIENQRADGARRLWGKLGQTGVPLLEWHAATLPGVASGVSANGLRVTLNGDQPEQCELLWKVAVAEGGETALTWRTSKAAPGLVWEVREYSPGLRLVARGAWDAGRLEFEGPRLVRLGLVYERGKGSMRLEGALDVQDVRLAAAR